MNRLVLAAQLVERGPVRYTPAGLPALDLVLAHESTLEHQGSVRKVSLQIAALAIGTLVQELTAMAIGAHAVFSGFIGARRNGRGILFHLTALAPSGRQA